MQEVVEREAAIVQPVEVRTPSGLVKKNLGLPCARRFRLTK